MALADKGYEHRGMQTGESVRSRALRVQKWRLGTPEAQGSECYTKGGVVDN